MKKRVTISEDTMELVSRLLSNELHLAQEENNEQYEMRVKDAIMELQRGTFR